MTDPTPFRAFTNVAPLEYPAIIGPQEFSGWQDEQLSWKQNCYIGDWSFVPQIRVRGRDALRLFKDLSVNSFENFPIGKAKHCIQCNDDGKVISEGILLRHGEDDFEYECGTPQWLYYNIVTGGYDVDVEFPLTHKLQVSGPKSLPLLEKLVGTSLRDVKFMRTKPVSINGIDAFALRQGMAGEIGFELHGPIQNHDAIYQAVWEAGQEFGIRRLGRRTIQINHLEACYPTGGIHFMNALSDDSKADYRKFMDENLPPEWEASPFAGPMRYNFATSFTGSWDGTAIEELYRSPVEMGWTKAINFDHDFVGSDALKAEVTTPRRSVVTLEFNSDDVIDVYRSLFQDGPTYHLFEVPHAPWVTCWTDKILLDGKTVGHATHPGYSAYFKRALALSFIDVDHSAPGTPVSVLWGNPGEPQTEIRATVAPAPYKQDERRRDLSTLSI
ncbi:glycine cleavage T C-terminal barrel domain-containing protein [Nocardioides sp. NPDC127514]|uniref:glycine cleavage T C-terminal barrel domain-containing protein n=1 Tax=unclassified Nocardioides TaxID=2615069 RepID=UPI00331936FA